MHRGPRRSISIRTIQHGKDLVADVHPR
jgi:hypothetical protein